MEHLNEDGGSMVICRGSGWWSFYEEEYLLVKMRCMNLKIGS